jgi:hypothetical protein
VESGRFEVPNQRFGVIHPFVRHATP